MAAPGTTRFSDCFQINECTKEGRCKRNWYRWLQFCLGTTGFIGFICYGSYIAPFYDLPIILACYVISLVSLINCLLAVWKMRNDNYKRRNDAAAANSSGDIEMNLQQNSPKIAENNGNTCSRSNSSNNINKISRVNNHKNTNSKQQYTNSSNKSRSRRSNKHNKALESSEEFNHLRKMLRQVLAAQNTRIDAYYQSPAHQQPKHHKTLSPYHPSWINWEVHKFPGENRLRRTESYESSLKIHQRRKHLKRPLNAQDKAFCTSSSDHDTYIYSSSSDGAKSSSHGWKTATLTRESPLGASSEATSNHQSIPPSAKTINHLDLDKTKFHQHSSRLLCDLPEQFPILPFPPRTDGVDRYRNRQGIKKFKLRDESLNPTRWKSMIDLDQCEHMSRKDVLKVLANLSPESIVPGKSKRSRKKHHIPRNMGMQLV